jgi:hypothetical protein
MHTQLYAAIEESIAQGTLERTLRLLVQHIPRYPFDSQLRRLVIHLMAAEGLIQETRSIFPCVVSIDRVRGRIPGLLATARLAEGMGLPADDAWRAISALVARRVHGTQVTAEPEVESLELASEPSSVERRALLALAAEVAAAPVDELPEQPVARVPLLTHLSDSQAMELLHALRLTIVPANSPALSAEKSAAWLIMGAFADSGEPAHWLPEGTLLTRHTPAPSTAAWMLAIEEADWERLGAQPEIRTALQNGILSAQAAAIIGRSALTQAAGPAALAQFLAHALAFAAPAGVIRPAGERSGGVGMVVAGSLNMVLRNENDTIHVLALQPGDTFGAESGPDAEVALLQLVGTEPVRWIWLPEDHAGLWLSQYPAALHFLAGQAAARAAELRRLRDSLSDDPINATEFDDVADTSVRGAGSSGPQ